MAGLEQKFRRTTKLTDPATSQLQTSPRRMAEIMNDFYVLKVQRIRKSLPRIGDPLKLLRRLMAGRKSTFSLAPVHPDEVN